MVVTFQSNFFSIFLMYYEI
uniref:Uncharacterized protein n=1 Tax=Rhizophora mucronata TaxID=61149 RepID=A0A2P2Q9B3_RHIMU